MFLRHECEAMGGGLGVLLINEVVGGTPVSWWRICAEREGVE